MKSRMIAAKIILFGLMVLGSCSLSRRTGPDNIVLIMADDLGYEGLSVNGSIDYQTPNLDQLASDGMRFSYCYAQPLCTPSRVQIMTGRYNFRNYKQFGYLNLNEKTFAYYLKKAGYTTGIAGKWQLDGGIEAPYLAGFDEYCLWQIYNHIAGVDKRGSRYADPKYYLNGKVYEAQNGLYGPDVFTDFGLQFIEKHQKEPFFLYYPMVLTHDPFCPTPDSDNWESDPFEKDTSYFKDMVEYTDHLVGLFRKKLDELGLSKHTYLIFTGDNGTSRSIYTLTVNGVVHGGKSLTHEYGIHVPLIVYAPDRVAQGKVSPALIDFTDFHATLLDIAGIKPDDGNKVDGYSFLPVLSGKTESVRDYIYGYYWNRGRNPLLVHEYVRDHKYKYYRDGRAYDAENDPEEHNNLASDLPQETLDSYKMMLNQVRVQKD